MSQIDQNIKSLQQEHIDQCLKKIEVNKDYCVNRIDLTLNS